MKTDFLIVEDELLIAESIAEMLESSGYTNFRKVVSVEEAVAAIEERRPDMVLTDIQLGRGKTGIDLGSLLHTQYSIPFIYITSHSSAEILAKAKHTRPNAYIVKPFKAEDLLVAIELALFNIIEKTSSEDEEQITLKEGRAMIRITTSGIQWLENEGNYTTINLEAEKRRVVRMSLGELQEQLPAKQFIRIHKSYIVNAAHVNEVRPNSVFIGGLEFPVGRTYQQGVKAFFGRD